VLLIDDLHNLTPDSTRSKPACCCECEFRVMIMHLGAVSFWSSFSGKAVSAVEDQPTTQSALVYDFPMDTSLSKHESSTTWICTCGRTSGLSLLGLDSRELIYRRSTLQLLLHSPDKARTSPPPPSTWLPPRPRSSRNRPTRSVHPTLF
jgi:hypothetical protein